MSSPDNPQMDPQLPPGKQPGPSFPVHSDPYLTASDMGVGTLSPVQKASESPVWNGWDVLAIVGLTLVTIFLSQVVIVFGAHYVLFPKVRITDLAQWPIVLLVAQFVIDGAVALYLFLLVEGKYQTPFWSAIRWNWPRSLFQWLGIGALMLIGLAMLESILPMPKDTPFEKLFANPRDAYLLAIMAVTLGPLVEELFFRGLFYPVVARRWGAGWGVLITALPFALMHLPQYGYAWGALLVIFVVGVSCGVVRAATGSVGSSFLVHVGYNGTQMLLAIFFTRGFTHMPKGLMEWYCG